MQQWHQCPQCSKDILYRVNPCPYCKCSLAWSQQGPVQYLPPAAQSEPAQQPQQTPKYEQQHEDEPPKTKLTLAHKITAGIILLGLGIFGTCAICICNTPTEKSTQVDLNASIRFDGSQFIIANNDSFDWSNVKFELNSEGLSSGFILEYPLIAAGKTYTVGSMQFAKPDGTRFNPFLMKPVKMVISCDTPDGKRGWYVGGW
jgi:hypothetical protein